MEHRRTGPFSFGGGGGTTFFARILYLCPKSQICLGNAFLSHMPWGWGGVWRRRILLFLSDCIGTMEREGVGGVIPLPRWENFWILGY